MIPKHWKTSLARFVGHGQAISAATPRAGHLHGSSGSIQRIKIGDVPVFDRRRRQVGFIAAPVERTGGHGLTSAQCMSHCMNEAVSWLRDETGEDEVNRLVGTVSLSRVPLMDNNNQICGIVILGAACPGPEKKACPPARGNGPPVTWKLGS